MVDFSIKPMPTFNPGNRSGSTTNDTTTEETSASVFDESINPMPAYEPFTGSGSTTDNTTTDETFISPFDQSIKPMPAYEPGTQPFVDGTEGTQPKTAEEVQKQTAIQKSAQGHMNVVMSKDNSHEQVRLAMIAEMKAIFVEYEDDPDTRDAVVAAFIKLIDKQQGSYINGNDAISMEDNKLADSIIALYQDEPVRLMAVLNNSEPAADPDNKASTESGEWAKWGLNRKLRFALAKGENGSVKINDMENIRILVQRIIQQEEPEKLKDLQALVQFVYNSGTIESGTNYQIDIAQVRDIINGIDSSILTNEQKEELRNILVGTN